MVQVISEKPAYNSHRKTSAIPVAYSLGCRGGSCNLKTAIKHPTIKPFIRE